MTQNYSFPALATALLLASAPGFAQTLTNNGATITVQSGAVLSVEGGVLNKAGSALQNDGTLQTTGDVANAGTLSGAGLLRFTGSADQQLTPGGADLTRLEVANTGAAGANRVLLRGDLSVSNQLLLSSGLLRTDPTVTLTLPDGATLSGEQTGRYVQGNLKVVRAAGSGVLDFGHGAALDRTGLGQVAITRTAGLQTDNVSRGVNFTNAGLKGIDRIWAVETAVAPAAPVPVTLQWLADDDNGLTSFAQAQAWHADLGSALWGPASGLQAATVSGSSRSFSFSTAALGRLTVSNAANPLPVELALFTAEPLGENDGLLKWATASEKNNDHFEVEASADGKAFGRIGTVKGHGSTTQPHDYQLVDKNLTRYAADVVYYRLRQVDQDGTASYSPVRNLKVAAPLGLTAAAWPNPFGIGGASLSVRTASAGPATLQVLDALGRALLRRALELPAGLTTVALPELGQLATGPYVLRLAQGGQQASLKVVHE
ncbi:T9SS type A sorting domain-containing protein [Hymenobacter ruricola]|uniref:T9SS type A sorting domain-containing protein n=1 Tax=Hymenobacter ruricola TaxID=2791023 RepID=A0ABS0I7A2_9BACT|nr:T9SS type A sorting domain-containing protein [Hymenobacter ruricola]MBF9222815.1 T9SS type A sorting domain-containing protein [Hymenobacter ruricola]